MMEAFVANLYLKDQPNGTLFEAFQKKNNLIKHLKEECGYKQVADDIFEKSYEGKTIKAVIARIQVQDTYLY